MWKEETDRHWLWKKNYPEGKGRDLGVTASVVADVSEDGFSSEFHPVFVSLETGLRFKLPSDEMGDEEKNTIIKDAAKAILDFFNENEKIEGGELVDDPENFPTWLEALGDGVLALLSDGRIELLRNNDKMSDEMKSTDVRDASYGGGVFMSGTNLPFRGANEVADAILGGQDVSGVLEALGRPIDVRPGRQYVYSPSGEERWSPKIDVRPGEVLIPVRPPLGKAQPGAAFVYVAREGETKPLGMVSIADLKPARREPTLGVFNAMQNPAGESEIKRLLRTRTKMVPVRHGSEKFGFSEYEKFEVDPETPHGDLQKLYKYASDAYRDVHSVAARGVYADFRDHLKDLLGARTMQNPAGNYKTSEEKLVADLEGMKGQQYLGMDQIKKLAKKHFKPDDAGGGYPAAEAAVVGKAEEMGLKINPAARMMFNKGNEPGGVPAHMGMGVGTAGVNPVEDEIEMACPTDEKEMSPDDDDWNINYGGEEAEKVPSNSMADEPEPAPTRKDVIKAAKPPRSDPMRLIGRMVRYDRSTGEVRVKKSASADELRQAKDAAIKMRKETPEAMKSVLWDRLLNAIDDGIEKKQHESVMMADEFDDGDEFDGGRQEPLRADANEQEEPEEGDITTEDHEHWHQYGKLYHVGDEKSLKAKMDEDKFWPNVFWISDHGNAHLITDIWTKNKMEQPAGSKKAGMSYKDALAAARKVGAGKSEGLPLLAQTLFALSHAHAINPETAYDGAAKSGMTAQQVRKLDPVELGNLMFVENKDCGCPDPSNCDCKEKPEVTEAEKFPGLDEFTTAYIIAALWSTTDESTPQGGEPLDKNYDWRDIAPETLSKMKADAAKFQKENADDITNDWSRAGHDFWLTREGHGAGFWDGDWPEDVGERLTQASKKYGEFGLYIGDDGKIHH